MISLSGNTSRADGSVEVSDPRSRAEYKCPGWMVVPHAAVACPELHQVMVNQLLDQVVDQVLDQMLDQVWQDQVDQVAILPWMR